jgi:hypothetical protein
VWSVLCNGPFSTVGDANTDVLVKFNIGSRIRTRMQLALPDKE